MPKPSQSSDPKEQLWKCFIKDLTEKGTGHISEFRKKFVKFKEY
jgi:hypothetical protein